MVNKKLLRAALAALVLLSAGGLVVRRIFISEETRIRNMVEETASALSKEAGQAASVGLGIRRMILNHFDDPCSINIPVHSFSGTRSPQELAAYAVHAMSFYRQLDISIHDFGVELSDKRRAGVRFTAVINGTTAGGERFRDVHELKAMLVQREGQWLFTHIEVVEVLQR